MYNSIRVILKTTILLSTLVFSFTPIQAQAFELLVNGFGTVCGSKSDLPKTATTPYPAYPFFTTLVNGNNVGIPFVSQVFYRPSYVGAERRWNFLWNSKFGLQFTAILDDKFKAVVQVVGRGETMNNNNYYAQMDWAYLQYNATNQLDFLFGRFRTPAFFYSDFLEVNHAQPWVMPPDEVYFIVGGAFRDVDGIKARYSYYVDNWTMNGQLYFGSFQEGLSILGQEIQVKVRDVIGAVAQVENDYVTFRGSVMRSIYDTSLYTPLNGIIAATNTFGVSQASQNLSAISSDKDQGIIYVGLAFEANLFDDFDILLERASILSPGIISTARKGMYGSLTYSMEKIAFTFTAGYSRALGTEVHKYLLVQDFFNTPQYLNNIDKGSGAGAAVVEQFKSYLGAQRSYALDVRYDVLPSLSLKGNIKYVTPTQNGPGAKYVLNRLPVYKHFWVYRVSFDFVF